MFDEMKGIRLVAALCLGLGACAAEEEGGTGAADGAESTGGGEDDGTSNPFGDDGDGGGAGDGGGGPGGGGGTDGGGATSGGGADDDDGGGNFIMPPDGGVEGQCDPAGQDCPEGQKCTSYVSTPGGATVDATKCVESTGDKLFGETCTRESDNDDCAPGFFCMTEVSGNTGEGICLEYCAPEGGDGECESGGQCFAFNDGALPVCQTLCNPLTPEADCAGGQGCYAAFDSFVCAVPGPGEGGGGDGAPCSTIQGCDPGLVCGSGSAGCTGESGCCTPFCDMNGPADQCPGDGEECVQALEMPPPMLGDVGLCTIPE